MPPIRTTNNMKKKGHSMVPDLMVCLLQIDVLSQILP